MFVLQIYILAEGATVFRTVLTTAHIHFAVSAYQFRKLNPRRPFLFS